MVGNAAIFAFVHLSGVYMGVEFFIAGVLSL